MADDDGGNVIDFPRIGFVSPTAPPPAGPPTDLVDPAPTAEPESAEPPQRHSPLDTLAALTTPVSPLPAGPPLPFDPPLPEPALGFVPDTFRAEPQQDEEPENAAAGPRLGALSLAAMLAVAVAAVRGIHTAVTNRRATRKQQEAVAKAARGNRTGAASGGSGNGGGGGRGKVPASHEWGRKLFNRHGGGGRGGPKQSTAMNNGSSGRRRGPGPGGNTGGGTRTRGAGALNERGRKGRDRARQERFGRLRPSPSGGASTRKSRTNTGTGAGAGGSGGGTGANKRRRPKAPTGAAGPKGTLRPPKGSGSKGRLGKGGSLSGTRPTGGKKPRAGVGASISAMAARRLQRRRKHLQPPITIRTAKKNRNKQGPAGKPGAARAKATNMKWKKRNSSGSGAAGKRWQRIHRRMRIRWERRWEARTGAPYGESAFTGFGGRRETPWESAGMAADGTAGTTANGRVWVTVERLDNVGDAARRPREPGGPVGSVGTGPRALAAAPTPHTRRPGTTAPKSPTTPKAPSARGTTSLTKETGMALPSRVPGFDTAPAMSSEHTTEITLDDTLKALESLTQDSFTAHDEAARLAQKARELRHALEELAADLQSRHNVIGSLTGRAMAFLAESMEVLSAQADTMATSSLAAAELSEAAEQAMFDAYKPVQRAAADAGLAVPSARIHNEG